MATVTDANGVPLRDGARVRLLRATSELLHGLPPEDQRAIEWARDQATLRLVGSDVHGNICLEFDEPDGTGHWISVSPTDVAAA